ncbi:hypothetical protein HK16_04965, partial [Acetobacter senegalensis]
MTDKPTSVFVRLPLSDEHKIKIVAEMMLAATPVADAFEKAISVIGTLVDSSVPVMGYIPEEWALTKRDGTNAGTFEDRAGKRHTIPLVCQSDHVAKLAERNAEIARLKADNDQLKRKLTPQFF